MANEIKAKPGGRKKLVRRESRNPPVHEVIIDVQFQRTVDEKPLRELRERLAASFPKVDQQNLMVLQMGMDFSGQASQGGVSQFAGWLARDEGLGWVLQTAPAAFTLHLVRPGAWPAGKYMGWSAIYARFRELHQSLADVYGQLELKRAGVRYLNRIAIPQGEAVAKWVVL